MQMIAGVYAVVGKFLIPGALLTMALNFGYRYLSNDYSNAGVYGWDIVQQGPVVGYTWKF